MSTEGVITAQPTAAFEFSVLQFISVAALAILTSSVSELISWALLYRKQSYKMNKGEIEKLNKKLEKLKSTHVIQAQAKNQDKKIVQTEAQLKSINQQMTFEGLKSNLLVAVVMIGAINTIGTYFQGVVVAVLPFEPFSLIRGMTHRNIAGEDFTQAAYLPVYIISAFIWRSNLKKFLGFEPPKAAVSMFDPPKYKPE